LTRSKYGSPQKKIGAEKRREEKKGAAQSKGGRGAERKNKRKHGGSKCDKQKQETHRETGKMKRQGS
jgi:hypothetical protein